MRSGDGLEVSSIAAISPMVSFMTFAARAFAPAC